MVGEDEIDDPKVQAWFDRTTVKLQEWGLPVTRETVEHTSTGIGRAWLGVRTAVVMPAGRYAAWTGARQSWRMFGTVPSKSAYLRLEVKRDGAWERG